MIVTIHQPEYFPYVGLIQKIYAADTFIIYDSCQFEKNNYQNRNQIMQFGKSVFTSVPVDLPNGHLTKITDVLIKRDYYDKVLPKLRKQLNTEYSKCPHYSQVMDILEEIWFNEPNSLRTLNSQILCGILQYLGINRRFLFSSDLDHAFKFQSSSTQHLIDLCNAVGATEYLSGQGGKNYMDEGAFERSGIKLSYFESQIRPYQQKNYESFVPYLSVLDGLFNHGKEFINYIKLK